MIGSLPYTCPVKHCGYILCAQLSPRGHWGPGEGSDLGPALQEPPRLREAVLDLNSLGLGLGLVETFLSSRMWLLTQAFQGGNSEPVVQTAGVAGCLAFLSLSLSLYLCPSICLCISVSLGLCPQGLGAMSGVGFDGCIGVARLCKEERRTRQRQRLGAVEEHGIVRKWESEMH